MRYQATDRWVDTAYQFAQLMLGGVRWYEQCHVSWCAACVTQAADKAMVCKASISEFEEIFFWGDQELIGFWARLQN